MHENANLVNVENSSQIDSAWLTRIVRDVIAQVQAEGSQSEKSDEMYGGNLVTLDSIERVVAAGKKEIRVGKKTVVTPAARDEAMRVGIAIRRGGETQNDGLANDIAGLRESGLQISDSQDLGRAELMAGQLARRNAKGSATIVISDAPAVDVYRHCCEKRRAVMVADIASVGRFASELSPEVWVLDMAKLNLIAAVNVAQQILQRK